MNELIETLRGMADMLDGPQNAGNLVVPSIINRLRDASNAIEQLEAENAALRAQQKQPNEPLTLDELLILQEPMPLWIVSIGDDFKPHWPIGCWIDSRTLFEILGDNSTNTMSKRDVKSTYGKTWLAYRCKPEQEE